MVLFPEDQDLKLLNTIEEKKQLLEKAGVQHLIIHQFTKKFSRISSINYVRDILVNEINTHKLVIGYNHHFGRNREGSFEHLQKFASVYGFEVEEIPVQFLDNVDVSSTKIRKALFLGYVDKAAEYLGYQYELSGTVVKGSAIGRSIGFPTANLDLGDVKKIIPADGVYAVWVIVDKITYKGMMNIGKKPTLNSKIRTLEIHLLDFDQYIYNKQIKIKFVKRIRDEIAFSELIELKKQLEKDRKLITALLS